MKDIPENCDTLAGEIEATERKLKELEREVNEIGEPACSELHHRIEELKIEERALKRNYSEMTRGTAPGKDKLRKVEALLHHIESEESSLEHEADFLHQASPTTLEFAFRSGARVFDLGARGLKSVKGDHQLLWHSPFVNTTYKSLSERFILPTPDTDDSDR